MNSTRLVFLILFGAGAVWFGWRVFMTSSMVRSALSLLASMALTGLMFLTMQAEFLGILQIMMMATEMSIMAIFMMMYMMDPGGMGDMDMTHQKRPSLLIAGISGILLLTMTCLIPWPLTSLPLPDPSQQNHDLGMEIMKRSMMIFETAGVSILVAMIAAAATALSFTENKTK